ncbi:hypothetical protein HPB49_005291 [Dermacentor silvarum]|uniref:Uncharacterized protein n=1 Tax=Dermacentor silvarum TaxID=543639 RepID=A0ACB8DMN6_DERSI|nr:hypothetical protein HPB49_005291 [Dermacentor silvarum]
MLPGTVSVCRQQRNTPAATQHGENDTRAPRESSSFDVSFKAAAFGKACCFTDAAKYPGRRAYVAAVVNKDGTVINARTVCTDSPEVAEQVAISLALLEDGKSLVYCDSKRAILSFGTGSISPTVGRILGTQHLTPHYINWFPVHTGPLEGPLPHLNETAHEAARDLTHRKRYLPYRRPTGAAPPAASQGAIRTQAGTDEHSAMTSQGVTPGQKRQLVCTSQPDCKQQDTGESEDESTTIEDGNVANLSGMDEGGLRIVRHRQDRAEGIPVLITAASES